MHYWLREPKSTVLRNTRHFTSACLAKHCKAIDFLSRVSTLMRDIDIVNLFVCPSVRPSVCLSVCLSVVRDVPILDENGLTYGHSFFNVW